MRTVKLTRWAPPRAGTPALAPAIEAPESSCWCRVCGAPDPLNALFCERCDADLGLADGERGSDLDSPPDAPGPGRW